MFSEECFTCYVNPFLSPRITKSGAKTFISLQGNVDVNRKKGCGWILVSHELVDPEEAWKLLEASVQEQSEKCDKPENDDSDKPETNGPDKPENRSEMSNDEGIVTLKFEPFILHVQCRDLESAKALHTQRFYNFSLYFTSVLLKRALILLQYFCGPIETSLTSFIPSLKKLPLVKIISCLLMHSQAILAKKVVC